MNFKKLSPSEIKGRITRISGEGWVTPEDYGRFSRQAVLILEELVQNRLAGRPVAKLEEVSGAKRVASRIDELRDEWEIETSKSVAGTAIYTLISRRWEARKKKAHCSTCHCFSVANEVPAGQIGLGL